MLSGYDIVCMASANYDGVWVNVQHIMSRLAEKNRILYVESVGLRPPRAGAADFGKIVRRVKGFMGGLRKIENGPWILSPGVLPSCGSNRLAALNDGWLTRQVAAAAGKIGLRRPILWIFLPTAACVAGRLDERALVYHVVDEYAANPGVDRERIARLDRELVEKADLVFATAPALAEKRTVFNPNTVLVTNVADFGLFSRELAVPDALETLPHPRLGFWGNLAGYKIDFELLAATARKRPAWQIVLIGPVGHGDPDTDLSNLKRLPNVHLFPPVGRAELPGWLAGFDVCLLPNALNETTRGVFPMKFYEYFAQGKPVVATPLDALVKSEALPLVEIAATPDDYVAAVERALAEGDEKKAARIALARKNSWEHRIEDISEQVAATLEKSEDRK